jgi:surface protein
MSCIGKISGKTIVNADSINGRFVAEAKYVDDVALCLEFSFRLDTTLGDASNNFSIPLPPTVTPDFVVQWGDGVTETITDSSVASLTHTYSSSGQYDVIITGSLGGEFGRGNTTHIEKVTSILNWGSPFTRNSRLQNFSNLSSIQATDYPVSIAGDNTFAGCENLNADLSFWKTDSYIGSFLSFFNGCTSFNGDVSGWSVSGSTQEMFKNCASFNQDLTMWDVSTVTILEQMFIGADSFDFNNINGWQFGDGCNASDMFDGRYGIGTYTQAEIAKFADLWESFDFPTQGENVNAHVFMISTSSFERMFLPEGFFPDADVAFNNLAAKGWTGVSDLTQPSLKLLLDTSLGGNTVTFPNTIGNNRIIDWGDGTWERIGNTVEPSHTYSSTGQYTCTIATNSTMTFQGTAVTPAGVSQLIEVTDTAGLNDASSADSFGGSANLTFVSDAFLSFRENLESLLNGCTSFNQDVSGWNVSSVSNTSQMFRDATSFNQDIGGWDVSSVTNMISMFLNASSFDQNLGAWQFKNNANAGAFLLFTGISNANLANSIIGWNSNPNQGTGVDWSQMSLSTLSESATVPVDGYDGAAAKSAYDNILLPTGSNGLGWIGNPFITWVA